MSRANTPWRPLTPASVEWNDSNDPVSSLFGDVYYSRDNGLEESRHVYLQGNELPQRWLQQRGGRFCITETGFGTGLNFLLTWQAWRELPPPRPSLHYVAIEKFPLSIDDMARALAAWPALQPLAQALLSHYPGLLPGQHRLLLEQGGITLDLWWEDVVDALADLSASGQGMVDAWYLDGFAPSRNVDMWRADILQAVSRLSRPQASFATFTAAGQVRRDLAAAGFSVSRVPGYGRKRECLRGRLEKPPALLPEPKQKLKETPWDLAHTSSNLPERVLVLGGGLAGCTVAAALARRGIASTVLEQGQLANAGSGNDQGVLYTRLSRRHSPLTDFALQSFRFATRYYRALFNSGQLTQGLDGALCGSFHQCDDIEEMAIIGKALAHLPELAQVLDRDAARNMLGIAQPSAGYWFPGSGWLRPVSVCRAVTADSLITVIQNCGELALEYSVGEWRAIVGGTVLATAPCAVVATGVRSAALEPLAWLPLQIIRGQTTDLPTGPEFAELRAALCHEGYIAPARDGRHCIGATFKLRDDDTAISVQEHRDNLEKLAIAVPAWRSALATLDPTRLGGRVGFRCASPDYLPLAGPVPDLSGFLHNYAALRKNARQTITSRGDYMPGLYLSTAHGSRGLTSTPLAAELLASQLCGEPLPLSRELCRAVAPARFLIRDLCRNRI